MSEETKPKILFRVICSETHFLEVEIEANDRNEAIDLANEDINLELDWDLIDITDREILDAEQIDSHHVSETKPCTTCGDVKGYDLCDCTRCVNCGHQHTFKQAREAKLWDEPKYCLIGECKNRHDKVDYILPGEEKE